MNKWRKKAKNGKQWPGFLENHKAKECVSEYIIQGIN
jgi:hypothetical protein